MMDFIAGLNYQVADAQQEGNCFKCGKNYKEEEKRGRTYYILDQTVKPSRNEIYCETCGIKIEEDRNETDSMGIS